MPALDTLRLDKWLWAARFFKTRKLAADAVSGGKVHVNGQRCKPSKLIKVAMQLVIRKDQLSWEITVLALNHQRRPAIEAVLLYLETETSQKLREQQQQQQKLAYQAGCLQTDKRPNKKQRRQIHSFKQG